MRYLSILTVTMAVIFVAGSARAVTSPAPLIFGANAAAESFNHYNPPPPPPPPPPPSKSCPCDSHGNPIDKNCGKGTDSKLP